MSESPGNCIKCGRPTLGKTCSYCRKTINEYKRKWRSGEYINKYKRLEEGNEYKNRRSITPWPKKKENRGHAVQSRKALQRRLQQEIYEKEKKK